MRASIFGMTAAAGLALSACGDMTGGQPEMDPITRAISGQTLTRGDNTIMIMPNGAMRGTTPAGELLGVWEVRDGQWCRTISAPENVAGTACQGVELGDGEITFLEGDGSPGNTWQIQ